MNLPPDTVSQNLHPAVEALLKARLVGFRILGQLGLGRSELIFRKVQYLLLNLFLLVERRFGELNLQLFELSLKLIDHNLVPIDGVEFRLAENRLKLQHGIDRVVIRLVVRSVPANVI